MSELFLTTMNKDEDTTVDEYFVTAIQIFESCGVKGSGTLRVNTLMDRFAPFVKSNKAEYSYLRSLLDPDQSNPEITVAKLATTLNKYSECQKIKVDLDESFNLKSGQAPHDSDSGISTDGYQLLEDLQCELREKSHMTLQLRKQLEFTDRQHEEALATLTAERDSLRTHLNMLREENMTLSHVRRDYEEVCERLCSSEHALDEARKELEGAKKRSRILHEQVVMLENEKLTLQEQLSKSKDECHRINEMYASRQVTLLEENETLRTKHADLSARLQDQDEFMQQIIKEKVRLEMELKEMLNKSNQTHLRMDRSIDVSYTEDQMLTALDSLHADTRFVQENHISDEESFINAVKDDHGRSTNISLFDEIRLSFCNMSRQHINEQLFPETPFESQESFITVATQTDYQYEENKHIVACTQTDDHETDFVNNNNINSCIDCSKCPECKKLQLYASKLENDVRQSHKTMCNMTLELEKCEENLVALKRFVDEGNNRNNLLQGAVESLKLKLVEIESACSKQGDEIQKLCCDTCSTLVQTDCDLSSVSTQAELPCFDCLKRKDGAQGRRLRKYLWEPMKWLFQIFAVVCFISAVCALYGVTRASRVVCRDREQTVPWRWLDANELMDLFLSIEYVADVPM